MYGNIHVLYLYCFVLIYYTLPIPCVNEQKDYNWTWKKWPCSKNAIPSWSWIPPTGHESRLLVPEIGGFLVSGELTAWVGFPTSLSNSSASLDMHFLVTTWMLRHISNNIVVAIYEPMHVHLLSTVKWSIHGLVVAQWFKRSYWDLSSLTYILDVYQVYRA